MNRTSKTKISTEQSSLWKRVATSVVLVVIICIALFNGSRGAILLLLGISGLGTFEYRKLIQKAGFSMQEATINITGWLLILMFWLALNHYCTFSALYVFIPLIPIVLAIELFRNQKTPFQNAGLTLLGIIWISLPLALFLGIGFLPFGSGTFHPAILLGYFIILWMGDTGAYFAGKYLGSHKLFVRISPNKTWEGSIGGMAFALLAGFCDFNFFHQLNLHEWLGLAAIINITGSFGDLVKSLLKRSVGVKDTGTILPGHGGILDRFDSLIGSVPFSFIYMLYYA